MKIINDDGKIEEVKPKKGEEGIYAKCQTCENPIYEHMTDNKELFNDTGMCGACATGESATYIDEL